MYTKEELLKKISTGLIVSCQALEGEPMYSENGGVMPLFALAALQAGAVGIRANSVRDIKEIKEKVDLPIIGIIKKDYPNTNAYITPSMKEVDELVEIGCDIIATDCTKNTRRDGQNAVEFVKEIKNKYPNQLIMADISCFEDVIDIADLVDFVGTTLSGYLEGQEKTDDPDFRLVEKIHETYPNVKIIAEGRIHEPIQALEMLNLGAFAVVVGGAITRPKEIAQRFIKEVKKYKV